MKFKTITLLVILISQVFYFRFVLWPNFKQTKAGEVYHTQYGSDSWYVRVIGQTNGFVTCEEYDSNMKDGGFTMEFPNREFADGCFTITTNQIP